MRAPPTAAVTANAACALVIPGDSGTLAPGARAPSHGALEARTTSERHVPNEEHAASDMAEPISVAIAGSVDPRHAPWPSPRNDAERMVFAQLYEPLLRIDCTGRIMPGLARAWSVDSSRGRWTFTLRDGATFADGGAVTAAMVIDSWRASAVAHALEVSGSTIASIAAGATAPGATTLVVDVPESLSTPAIFAATELAVARRSRESHWPLGTMSYYVDTVDTRAPSADTSHGSRSIILRSRSGSGALPPLLFQTAERRDARDILDAGIDILPTESAAAVQYAATQPGRAVMPLPWSRTYVLALPARALGGPASVAPGADRRECVTTNDAPDFRDELATAVHSAARGAERPFWWVGNGGAADGGAASATQLCSPSTATSTSPSTPASTRELASPPQRIVYPRDDATARELAERLVALTAPSRERARAPGLANAAPELLGAGVWRAMALDSANFARALAAGSEPAYVLALPRRVVAPSIASAALLATAPWVGAAERLATALVPLVDIRGSLIARRGSAPLHLTVDWDGVPRFDIHQPAAAERVP